MKFFSKKALGIDIGASSIKVVELSSAGAKNNLENYLEFKLPSAAGSTGLLKTFYGTSMLLLSNEVSDILQALFKRSKIETRKAAFSIPDFSTFFTTFDLPPMNEAEIPRAVEFEARHHIPLPLSEVVFDWHIIEKEQVSPGIRLKILLVAVPTRVLESYQRLASLCRLEVKGLEAEVFGLVRSSIEQGKYWGPVCLVDIGWQSTTVSIIDKMSLRASHSFDFSSSGLNKILSETLQISQEQADDLKVRYGLDPKKPEVVNILIKEIEGLACEVEKICNDFFQREQREIKDVVLAGGSANLFGLKEYLFSRLKKNIEFTRPFAKLAYPLILQKRLEDIGSSFAVACGVAMMALEN